MVFDESVGSIEYLVESMELWIPRSATVAAGSLLVQSICAHSVPFSILVQNESYEAMTLPSFRSNPIYIYISFFISFSVCKNENEISS